MAEKTRNTGQRSRSVHEQTKHTHDDGLCTSRKGGGRVHTHAGDMYVHPVRVSKRLGAHSVKENSGEEGGAPHARAEKKRRGFSGSTEAEAGADSNQHNTKVQVGVEDLSHRQQ